MLQLIRDRFHGIFVWIILSVIIAAFALVGVNAYLTDGGKAYVAKVNDDKIALSDFKVALQQERAFRKRVLGDNANPALLKDDVLRQAALDRLITSEVVAQAADEAGFRISNAQLAGQIRAMKDFQSDGKFDPSLYARILSLEGYSQERFEATVRNDMLSRQFMDGLTETGFATAHDTDQLLRLRKQQRRFAYTVLNINDVDTNDISIDDAAVQQYYDTHAGEFVTEEQASIKYIELSPDSHEVTEQPDEKTLRQMYQQQIVEFSNGEQRRASHILIKPADDSAAADKAAKQKAEELYKKITQGADFAELARENSDDPGSARQGGDLGYFARGVMVGAFEDKAFDMKEGEVSKPFKSPYGYHIIKLTGIREGDTKSFAEVRDDLIKRYRKEKADERFYDEVDRLTNLTYEHPETLEVAANELDIPIQTTGLFTRERGSGIASDAMVRQTAFSNDVLEAGYNSEVLTLPENRAVVLRIDEHRPSAQQPLADVRDIIVKRLQRQQAAEQLQKIGDKMIAALRDGADPETLAQEHGDKWVSSGFIDRNDRDTDHQVLDFIFSMPRPDDADAVFAGNSLADGNYVVAALYAVRDGNPEEVDEKQRQAVAEQRSNSLGQHLGARVIKNLKRRAEITEYTENL